MALFGGICLFLPKMNVLSWKQAQHDVDWGGIVLIAAGISLGLTVFETGAAHWLALVLMGEMGVVPALLRPFLIVLAVAMLHMLFSSNTVTGTIIIPILIALAASLGLAPWTLAGPAAFTSSLAFIPGHGDPDERDSLLIRLFLDQRHGQSWYPYDVHRGTLRRCIHAHRRSYNRRLNRAQKRELYGNVID